MIDKARRDLAIPFSEAEVREDLVTILRDVIHGAQERARRQALRIGFAGCLLLPFSKMRSGQSELIDAVTDSLTLGRLLLANAPTGIGKTIAVLLPALRYALAEGCILFHLTSRTVQQEAVARTFEDIVAALGPEG